MRIFTRYVLKEVLSHAVLGVSIFTFVIFMRDVGRILELIVRNSAPLPSVAELFFLTLPTALNLTIPMGVLVGILIGLSRMASDSEVTAMRASGVGAYTFAIIISFFAIFAWLLALGNSVYVAPKSMAALVELQSSLKNNQVSFEVQPRVFYENFKNTVLYVQDASTARDAAIWRNVFLADISNAAAPKITVAEQAIVVNEGTDTLRLHLTNGSQHESQPRAPEQYATSRFSESDIPIQIPTAQPRQQRDQRPAELSTSELWARSQDPDSSRARYHLIEFHRRFALPTACLVLALVGIPLGLSSKKGGKATGFVLTIALVFLYYVVSLGGVALARQDKLPVAAGVWLANGVFTIAGMVLLRRVDRSSLEVGSLRGVWTVITSRLTSKKGDQPHDGGKVERRSQARLARDNATPARVALILDSYIVVEFLKYTVMILATFLLITLVFTFFELLADIIRNKVALITVGDYLLNVSPSMIYLMTPLTVLVAVLVTFGLMQKSNEMTAMKATGISIYRAIVPVLLMSAMIAAGLFLFEQFYLPYANTRQEALRNSIKGKPAQTFLRPDRKWIFGQHNTIYYYEHFDPDQNEFASISEFQFDPGTFQIERRMYALRAHWEEGLQKWVLQKGWTRAFSGDSVQNYQEFEVATFPQMSEPPVYFKKEVKLSSEMNYRELRRYIQDLQQSGFDVARLQVQLQKKIAYPLITLVMAILAVPFALSTGHRGTLAGVGVAIGVAVLYLMASGLFEALGNVNQLPAALAAWAPDLLFGLVGGYLILKVPT